MTRRNCSGVSRVAGTAVPTPALLTSTSTRPSSVIAASTSAWQSSGEATSVSATTHPASGCAHQVGGLLEPVDPAGAEHHVGAGLGERLREGHPEAARGAGHDRHPVVETEQVGHGRHGRTLLAPEASLKRPRRRNNGRFRRG